MVKLQNFLNAPRSYLAEPTNADVYAMRACDQSN